ncbi:MULTISPECIES: DNA helicase RecQ [Bacillaceae]|uniref:DNA helicase RecQ n=1 Tax=Bacillaceae TaxID=186817 RepID=UPI000C770845|nr:MULTISPECIES: DNA helicase RecQ [Bacillaceae]PLR68791.1 DNA helicase RecQ [Bacillus sp. UMB0893]
MLEKAKEHLQHYFGYSSFRPGQEEIISHVLNGHHSAGIMPTGGGKSICYQIPALLFPGITLVISPLISLMKDQVDSLDQAGIPATFLNSTISQTEASARLADLEAGNYRILYVAPERLESAFFLEQLQKMNVSMVAVDEAHCISQWGHDFRPSYLRIKQLKNQLKSKPVFLALTATATPVVREDICESLGIQEEYTTVTGFERTNLSFKVSKGENRYDFIERYIEKNKTESGIIYAATRKEAELLFERLTKKGFLAGKYHGGMKDHERGLQQDLFLKDDIQVMVATNAFGMGIDKSNVRYVIHYQLPKNMESYYQEAGRAGRDGLDSECILLYSPQDIQIQRYLIEQSTFQKERQHAELTKLHQMRDYCHTEGCLQTFILNYFGDSKAETCGKCSNCQDERTHEDVTKDAQMVLSCMIRMGQRFGKTMISQVLTGSSNKKVIDFKFNELSTYGILKHRTAKEVSEFIDYLTSEQYIGITGGQFPVLAVEEKGLNVLKGNETVHRKEKMKIVEVQANDELFEQLKELRKQLAKEENVPPFVIFSDKSLKDMSAKMPSTIEEFLSVQGVGESKLKKYGEAFIEKIGAFAEKNPNLERTSHARTSGKKERKESSHLDSYQLFNEGLSTEEIAAKRGLSVITIENHLLRCAKEGMIVDFESWIPEQYEAQIEEAIRSHGYGLLKPLKEILPDEVSYFMIKAAIVKRELVH